MALRAAINAEQCHRHMDHIKPYQRLDPGALQTNANGVSFSREVSPCGICAIGKSIWQPDQKQSNLEITMPFQAVYADVVGSILSPATGGPKYLSKIIHEFTKYKEIYLIQTTEEAVDTIERYVQLVVASPGCRMQGLRADRGTQYTGKAL